jgi:hypothetical protein
VLPTGARRFDREDVQRVRAQIHPSSPDDAQQLADAVLLAGTTGSGKASVRWSRVPTDTQRQILVRVDRAVRVGEGELRYQLEHRDHHPLARADELLDVLAELEAVGLVDAELCFRLTAAGRQRLCQLDDDDGQGAGDER